MADLTVEAGTDLKDAQMDDVLSGSKFMVTEDPLTSQMSVTFPSQPCNDIACKSYIKSLGGCSKICNGIYGEDHFSGECKFGVRRRSFVSFWKRWGWTKKLFLKEGKPHKFMNCGCDCKYFDDQTPKRTFLAQYECWTCFDKNGEPLKPAPVATMKEYNFEELMDLNKRRGVTVHFMGPKHYDIRAAGITRPGI